jgi:hypothetical protein
LGEEEAKKHPEGPNPGPYAFLQDPASCKAQKIKTKQIKAAFFKKPGTANPNCMLAFPCQLE